MKLAEAMRIVRSRKSAIGGRRFLLACGFTPLHLETFLRAHLLVRLDGPVDVEIGIYGDLAGNLERTYADDGIDGSVVIIEWGDVDPRLAYRNPHGWSEFNSLDLLESARLRLARLHIGIQALAERHTVCVVLPTIQLPPCCWGPPGLADVGALALRAEVLRFGLGLAAISDVRVLSPDQLDWLFPIALRFDPNSDFRTGFPYRLEYASVLSAQLVELLCPTARKKGLITDLDNTLWSGILGEVGVDAVDWSLEHHGFGHAVYQGALASLASIGVLIGVASKNDPYLVHKALARRDLIVPARSLFPIRCSWGSKSSSVAQIIKTWNVHPDSVVFIDDSPLEIAEVRASFPQIEGILFPAGDNDAVLDLIRKLRSLFGKPFVAEEDRIRVDSLRTASQSIAEASSMSPDVFLRDLQAELVLEFNKPDQRVFELVNKTNQFNLNGHRRDESFLRLRANDPKGFLIAVSYKDRFGPLGKIAVVSGMRDSLEPCIDIWVMSCRAFSRRIEHQMLQSLFEWSDASSLQLTLVPTERNNPLLQFVQSITGEDVKTPMRIERSDFFSRCPSLYAKVVVE